METIVSCSILVDKGKLVLNDWMGASGRILLKLDNVLLGDFFFSFMSMALLFWGLFEFGSEESLEIRELNWIVVAFWFDFFSFVSCLINGCVGVSERLLSGMLSWFCFFEFCIVGAIH